MKKVEVASLLPGTISQQDYYSEKGDLLISKGVVITPRHISMLHKRNVFDVFTKMSSEEEELERLLAADFKKLGALDIDATPPPPPPAPVVKRAPQPKAFSLPGLRDIKGGKDGLSQLLASDISASLDNYFAGRTPDRPTGPALARKAEQVPVEKRTIEQKKDVSSAYDKSLADVTRILNLLADGQQVNGAEVIDIVKRFILIFITDHNILLNISGRKPAGGNYLYNHSLNVCLLAINIAASQGYSEPQVVEIGVGALLHDIGMLLIPQEIVLKQGRFSDEEWFEVQKHPILALHLLERVRNLPESVPFVAYQVHERENKTGYPKQRGGHLIHQFAKITQVADVYEAMSSPRTYRSAFIPYKAMENVIKMTRQGLMDGIFVEAFLRYASLFPVGSLVELSDHAMGKVVDANAGAFAKPVVSVLTDTSGKLLDKDDIYQVNLSTSADIYISRALPADFLKGAGLMDGF